MERVGRRERGGEAEAARVAVPLVAIVLPQTTWRPASRRRRVSERWAEMAVIGVTLLLVVVLFAGIRHAVVTSPFVPAMPGRMVFAPLVR